jgi:CDP-4-dehydro-6-deoxyglucose reductase, E3
VPTVAFDGQSFVLEPGEAVLDALIRHGANPPFSCRAGTCQSCLMRSVGGLPPAASQAGLKDALKVQGFFLPCVCRPDTDLAIMRPDGAGAAVPATVVGTQALSPDVVRMLVKADGPFEYRAGQFINLVREDGLIRSYSVASLPHRDECLELHVRRIPGGRMSNWIHADVRPGDRVHVRGPSGDCFYVPGHPDRPLLLAGTGTGLAPLYGVLQDALHHHHRGPIAVFHGAVDAAGLYLVEELSALAARHPHVRYHRCVLRGEASDGVEVGALDRLVFHHHPALAGWSVFLCGHPELVLPMRRHVFLAGAGMKHIHSDAFLMSRA